MKVLRSASLGFCLAAAAFATDPALTIYNQNFAVIRDTLPLDLKAGNNRVEFSSATAQLEPDSVVLRDAAGTHLLQVLEQNYRNDPVSQERLLTLNEGKTIEFAVKNQDGTTSIVTGKIIRSGFAPREQPVIEVNGKLQFSLPGQPIFPALGADTILKPALDWILYSAQAAKFEAELSYISGGLNWNADYNLIAPEKGDTMDMVGWVTLNNQSGKQFDHAHIKLMAGDVNKIQPPRRAMAYAGVAGGVIGGMPQVEEKAFEDYHLYTLPQPTTIHDKETKQVEFIRASGIQSKRIYRFDGAQPNARVAIVREFSNSTANHLGMPLPKGRLRFYRQDQDGQIEFTGENQIDHTAKDETLRVFTGNAFDITGERRQTNIQTQSRGTKIDDSYEIKLKNHKKEAATVRVVEHLNGGMNWTIPQESAAHKKVNSNTIEYEVTLQPDEERVLTYTAHYTS